MTLNKTCFEDVGLPVLPSYCRVHTPACPPRNALESACNRGCGSSAVSVHCAKGYPGTTRKGSKMDDGCVVSCSG
eukprot:1148776-Pelagomonas_calceolata.AAC.1